MKRFLRLHYVIFALVAFVLLLDAALWWIDPTGWVNMLVDHNTIASHSLPSPDGLRYEPGNYRLRQYRVTIGLDGFRAVPDSQLSQCRIAFVGDSVTFGSGSDISFVELLAPELPAQVINAGIIGYNAANILAELSMVQADGYIWLVVPNDADPMLRWALPTGNMPPAIILSTTKHGPATGDPEEFKRYASKILARDDLLAFAFADSHLSDLIAQSFPDVRLIPPHTQFVSAADYHPSPAGHQQIADAIRPEVKEFASKQCA